MSIKEVLDKVGQKGYHGNLDNAISSEDIQTSVVADTREVYQQGEICNGTKRSRTLTKKGQRVSTEDTVSEKEEVTCKDDKKM